MIELQGKKHADIEGISFCLRAMVNDKNDTRIHINHLLVKKGYAVATGGSCIHRYKLVGKYQSGLYRVFKVSKYNIVLVRTKLPMSDWPKHESIFKIKKPVATIHVDFYQQNYPYALFKVIRSLPGNFPIQPKYLEGLMDYAFDVKISDGEKGRVLFENGRKSAVIRMMPE